MLVSTLRCMIFRVGKNKQKPWLLHKTTSPLFNTVDKEDHFKSEVVFCISYSNFNLLVVFHKTPIKNWFKREAFTTTLPIPLLEFQITTLQHWMLDAALAIAATSFFVLIRQKRYSG